MLARSSSGEGRARASRGVLWLLGLALAFLAVAQVLVWIAGATIGRSLLSQIYGSGLANRLVDGTSLLLAVLAAVVISRRPRNPVGWLLLASCYVSLLNSAAVLYAGLDIQAWHRSAPLGDLVAGLQSYLWMPQLACIALLPALLFPDGRLVSARWRPVLYLTLVSVTAAYVGKTFGPGVDHYLVPGALAPKLHAGPGADLLALMALGLPLMLVSFALAVVSLAVRYRRATSEVRHQIRWLLASVVVYLIPWGVHGILLDQGIEVRWLADLSLVGLFAIPIAMAVAILKYRLYDIDVVINRALVYGALAVLITAVYVAIVVGIGAVIGAGGKPNLFLSIVATAVVAVAFQPARERVQQVANRLVYGERASPYEVLAEFSSRVAVSYAGETVLSRMAQVLAEGTGAARADVWLRAGDVLRPAAAWPDANGHAETGLAITGQLLPVVPATDLAVPVRHQGELLGALTITKRPGEPVTPIESKLLDDLAHQAGLVLRNVGLSADLLARLADLRASRQRLVAAQDQERRRLERNLHDGAQQHLVALKVKLGLAEMLTDRDPERAVATLQQLKLDADEALETLRDLARGIYPPLLADQGLVPALRAQARKAVLPVDVNAEGGTRYPQEIEAAVYFCCLEALQNVQKYASATRAAVHLSSDGKRLRFEISDDGVGFDGAVVQRGAGLQNMADRLAALDGELTLESTPGHGTTLRGWLPVDA